MPPTACSGSLATETATIPRGMSTAPSRCSKYASARGACAGICAVAGRPSTLERPVIAPSGNKAETHSVTTTLPSSIFSPGSISRLATQTLVNSPPYCASISCSARSASRCAADIAIKHTSAAANPAKALIASLLLRFIYRFPPSHASRDSILEPHGARGGGKMRNSAATC